MVKNVKFAVRSVIFLAILGVVLFSVNRVLEMKYFNDEKWPSTVTSTDFYKLEKDTVDVLFLGSSHAVSGFVPQVLYDEYGLTSYNLGSPQQNLLISYYWLKEALQTQSPKAVVLESYFVFPYDEDEVLNSGEAFQRMAMDFMQNGKVKNEAISDICSLDSNQSAVSYYFPFVRYHSRWTDLDENDFLYGELTQRSGMMGYSALTTKTTVKEYEPLNLEEETSTEQKEMNEIMEEYLQKLTDLCKENDIQLILTVIPHDNKQIEEYNTLKDFADRNQVPYYDFNTEALYNEIEFDFKNDMADKIHSNYLGAPKLTGYMGKVLTEEYGLKPKGDQQWENARENYEENMDICNLDKIKDLAEYLKALDKERYTVFMAARDEASTGITAEITEAFQQLGIKTDLEGRYQESFYAVIDQGEVTEEVSEEMLSCKGLLKDGTTRFEIISAGNQVGNMCSIKIGDEDYAMNRRGINIVVYDNESKKVIDEVRFDTGAKENKAYR